MRRSLKGWSVGTRTEPGAKVRERRSGSKRAVTATRPSKGSVGELGLADAVHLDLHLARGGLPFDAQTLQLEALDHLAPGRRDPVRAGPAGGGHGNGRVVLGRGPRLRRPRVLDAGPAGEGRGRSAPLHGRDLDGALWRSGRLPVEDQLGGPALLVLADGPPQLLALLSQNAKRALEQHVVGEHPLREGLQGVRLHQDGREVPGVAPAVGEARTSEPGQEALAGILVVDELDVAAGNVALRPQSRRRPRAGASSRARSRWPGTRRWASCGRRSCRIGGRCRR